MIAKHFRSTLAALLFLGGIAAAAQTHSTSPALHADPAYGKLPLAFEPNRGQVGGVAGSTSDVQFLARGSRYTVLLEPGAATLLLSHDDLTQAQARAGLLAGKPVTSTRTSVRMTLDGANPHAAMSPERLLAGYVSYMTGGNPSHWQVGLPTYAATRVAQAYPGIDLVYYGNERQLEYDFVVSPNADPATIHLAIEGARTLSSKQPVRQTANSASSSPLPGATPTSSSASPSSTSRSMALASPSRPPLPSLPMAKLASRSAATTAPAHSSSTLSSATPPTSAAALRTRSTAPPLTQTTSFTPSARPFRLRFLAPRVNLRPAQQPTITAMMPL